ncbi:HTH-type transcriptional regulator CynR [Pigmentiphaga humi]|uniref:HTH-type transcriptional regulator CynR n=1 Tax=Pigmentiphaga humi TaxID=2478468 RepID=A0A3P4AWU3_9BURK|nr:LysR family transcriptional regulator [Pigmentiphaga humi]VCU67968.1 HTH-type transcriptional regulator CynR [Pigmentiphaga humi]
MNISSRQLAAFVSVAQLGSFTRASEKAHMTQSGLSIMIRELEGQLGCRLFDRTTRSVRLTEAGALLLPVAMRATDDLGHVVGEIAKLEVKQQRSLRIGCTPMLAAFFLPIIYQEFRDAHPLFSLQLIDAEAAVIQEQVKAGELDCGLGIFFKPISGIQRSLLFRSRLIYVRASHQPPLGKPLSELPTLHWADLPELPLLKLPQSSPIQQLVEKQLQKCGLNRPVHGQFNHIETVVAMAAAGAGGAVVPAFAWGKCAHYGIEGAFIGEPNVTVDFYLTTARGKLAPESVKELSDVLSAALERVAT